MKDRTLAVGPQGGGMIVAVRGVPERRGGLPFLCPVPQPRRSDAQLASRFGQTGVPDRQEVAVRALDNRGIMIVLREQRSIRAFRDPDVRPRPFEVGSVMTGTFGRIGRDLLRDLLPIQRLWRKRQGLARRYRAQNDAEADQPSLVIRQHATTIGRSKKSHQRGMAAAACDAKIARNVANRIGLFARNVRSVPVGTPFFDVAVHVIKSPSVGLSLRHGQGDNFAGLRTVGSGKPTVPHILVKRLRQRVAGVIGRCRVGTAGVFPLGLSRQTIGLALLLAQPFAERCGVVPTHEHDRFIVGFRKAEFAAEVLVMNIELLVLRIGHLGGRYVKRLRDDGLVNRPLIPVACFRAHSEGARLDQDHLHAQRVHEFSVSTRRRRGH